MLKEQIGKLDKKSSMGGMEYVEGMGAQMGKMAAQGVSVLPGQEAYADTHVDEDEVEKEEDRNDSDDGSTKTEATLADALLADPTETKRQELELKSSHAPSDTRFYESLLLQKFSRFKYVYQMEEVLTKKAEAEEAGWESARPEDENSLGGSNWGSEKTGESVRVRVRVRGGA